MKVVEMNLRKLSGSVNLDILYPWTILMFGPTIP